MLWYRFCLWMIVWWGDGSLGSLETNSILFTNPICWNCFCKLRLNLKFSIPHIKAGLEKEEKISVKLKSVILTTKIRKLKFADGKAGPCLKRKWLLTRFLRYEHWFLSIKKYKKKVFLLSQGIFFKLWTILLIWLLLFDVFGIQREGAAMSHPGGG